MSNVGRISFSRWWHFMYLLLMAVSFFLASGCSVLRPGVKPEKAETTPSEAVQKPPPSSPDVIGSAFQADAPHRVVTTGGSSSNASPDLQPPLDVSVAQAFYVGTKLNLKIHVRAKTEFPSGEILVSVLGLREGQIVERHEKRLSEVYPVERLSADEAIVMRFVLERSDLSEYQVVCGWGKDARQVTQSAATSAVGSQPANTLENTSDTQDTARALAPTAEVPPTSSTNPLGGVSIQEVELEEQVQACAKPPCDIRYTIMARLVNSGAQNISRVKLAVGLAWAEGSTLPKPPADFAAKVEGEDIVDLTALELRPQASKKLRVSVDRAIPVVPGGAFIPYVRLLSIDSTGN